MNRPQRIIHRGELYYADLNPVFGSEQGGTVGYPQTQRSR